jgi:hypothetical protein
MDKWLPMGAIGEAGKKHGFLEYEKILSLEPVTIKDISFPPEMIDLTRSPIAGTDKPCRSFEDFEYRTQKSWGRPRRTRSRSRFRGNSQDQQIPFFLISTMSVLTRFLPVPAGDGASALVFGGYRRRFSATELPLSGVKACQPKEAADLGRASVVAPSS